MSARAIARALAGHEVKAHRGNYQVCCPAHDDCSPSLSLRDGSHGLLTRLEGYRSYSRRQTISWDW
jgi:hypothetical protein